MAARKRNPLLGGIMAMLMIGFGSYRFYMHYSGLDTLETWQMIISGAFIVYGLYVGYSVLTQPKETENNMDNE